MEKLGSRPGFPLCPEKPREQEGHQGEGPRRVLVRADPAPLFPTPGENKRRDLERDPEAGDRAWTSWPQLVPRQGAGIVPGEGVPRLGLSETAGWRSRLTRGSQASRHSCAGRFLAARSSFHLGSLCLRTDLVATRRGGAGRGGGTAGRAQGPGQPTSASEQPGGSCEQQAELGLQPRRDRVGAEAKGRSGGAQQGTSCCCPCSAPVWSLEAGRGVGTKAQSPRTRNYLKQLT